MVEGGLHPAQSVGAVLSGLGAAPAPAHVYQEISRRPESSDRANEFPTGRACFRPIFQQGIPHLGHFHNRRNGEEKAYIAIFLIWQGPAPPRNQADKHYVLCSLSDFLRLVVFSPYR